MSDLLKTGSVNIDLSDYSGEDVFPNGELKDSVCNLIKENPSPDYQKLIEEQADRQVLYQLSYLRSNVVEWLPIREGDRVLEIGSGCGAITSMLASKNARITCVDLSKKHSEINALRNRDYGDITIHVGRFEEVEKKLDCDYDFVLMVGSFEQAPFHVKGANCFEELLRLSAGHLSESGRLVMACSNRFGLKYWAGCKEDNTRHFFEGIEGFTHSEGARSFSKNEISDLYTRAGIGEPAFYYPYPDYGFMQSLYSQERLPNKGELTVNNRNVDGDRLVVFDETAVYNQLAGEREFEFFSNSFLCVSGKKPETVYCRYSNERGEHYALKTEILSTADGLKVRKKALSKLAEEQLKTAAQNYAGLLERYGGSSVRINRCEYSAGELLLEYEAGKSLEELLDNAIESGDEDLFKRYILKYKDILEINSACNFTDYDCIFQNILVDGDDWTIIDYEWCERRAVPMREIAFRAWYCYTRPSVVRESFLKEWFMNLFGISEEEFMPMVERESAYQKKVTGDRLTLLELGRKMGTRVYSVNPEERIRKITNDIKSRAQVFLDYGKGFSEENSFFPEATAGADGSLLLNIKVPAGVRKLRIDPCMYASHIKLLSFSVGGKNCSDKIRNNGVKLSENSYLFTHNDPYFIIEESWPFTEKTAEIQFIISDIPEDFLDKIRE